MGDLALMNSIKLNYKIDKIENYDVDTLINSWSPYKTVASLLFGNPLRKTIFIHNMLTLLK